MGLPALTGQAWADVQSQLGEEGVAAENLTLPGDPAATNAGSSEPSGEVCIHKGGVSSLPDSDCGPWFTGLRIVQLVNDWSDCVGLDLFSDELERMRSHLRTCDAAHIPGRVARGLPR